MKTSDILKALNFSVKQRQDIKNSAVSLDMTIQEFMVAAVIGVAAKVSKLKQGGE